MESELENSIDLAGVKPSGNLPPAVTVFYGRTGQGTIARQRLIERNCKIGSLVGGHMQGAMLVIDALACGEQR